MNKYALVTGASSGIGFQYARVMARRGYNVIIVSNEEAVNVKAEELKSEFTGVEVVAMVCDLGKPESAKELYEKCAGYEVDVRDIVQSLGVGDFICGAESDFRKKAYQIRRKTILGSGILL